MKTLTEINAERMEIIEEGIANIAEKAIKGRVYSAEELSVLSGGLIPAKNLQTSFNRAADEVIKPRPYRDYGKYFLYGELPIKPVRENRTLTYKVYDENGEFIREFTKNKYIYKAMVV